jgi:hypothetical protein
LRAAVQDVSPRDARRSGAKQTLQTSEALHARRSEAGPLDVTRTDSPFAQNSRLVGLTYGLLEARTGPSLYARLAL